MRFQTGPPAPRVRKNRLECSVTPRQRMGASMTSRENSRFSVISIDQALLQAAQDHLPGQFDSYEDKSAYPSFPVCPWGTHIVAHQLVDALQHHLPLRALHVEDS